MCQWCVCCPTFILSHYCTRYDQIYILFSSSLPSYSLVLSLPLLPTFTSLLPSPFLLSLCPCSPPSMLHFLSLFLELPSFPILLSYDPPIFLYYLPTSSFNASTTPYSHHLSLPIQYPRSPLFSPPPSPSSFLLPFD